MIREKGQRSSRRRQRVFLAQTSSGRVARIREDLGAEGDLLAVHFLEIIASQEHLATNFDAARRHARQRLRDVSNRADVLGHVLAHSPVAARRRLDQYAFVIHDRQRETVNFRLDRETQVLRVPAQTFRDALHPLAKFSTSKTLSSESIASAWVTG